MNADMQPTMQSQMQSMGYLDGEIAPLDEIRIPVLDRGFLYGDSVYEVFRTYDGIPFMFDEHYARLRNSARLCGMNIAQDKREISDAIRATVAAAGPTQDIYVRYQITRGQGAITLLPEPKLRSRLVVIVQPLPRIPPRFYQVGMAVAVSKQQRNSVNSLDPNIKGGNYLNNILALSEVHESGADDCVMLDAQGRVTECANSNIWLVIDGAFATPAHGNLAGLTRQKLVELITGAGHPNPERSVHSDELAAASECFVTSATREVMPVASLVLGDGSRMEFPPGGGERTRWARQAYAQMLSEFVRANAAHAWF